MKQIMLNK